MSIWEEIQKQQTVTNYNGKITEDEWNAFWEKQFYKPLSKVTLYGLATEFILNSLDDIFKAYCKSDRYILMVNSEQLKRFNERADKLGLKREPQETQKYSLTP